MSTSNGIEVTSVTKGPPSCAPVTDVGVSYDGAALSLTLPGYLDKPAVLRALRHLCKGRTGYYYLWHGWRNAVAQTEQLKR